MYHPVFPGGRAALTCPQGQFLIGTQVHLTLVCLAQYPPGPSTIISHTASCSRSYGPVARSCSGIPCQKLQGPGQTGYFQLYSSTFVGASHGVTPPSFTEPAFHTHTHTNTHPKGVYLVFVSSLVVQLDPNIHPEPQHHP